MRVMERLCPQTWWQWAIYGVMAALLALNVALANMQALDAASMPHAHHHPVAPQATQDAGTAADSSVHQTGPASASNP